MMSMMDYVQYVQIRMPPHVCLLCMSNRRQSLSRRAVY
jgi:hypothetical protein